MTKSTIEFTVTYSIDIDNADLHTLELLVRDNQPVAACKLLMDRYAVTLAQANCIRKFIMLATSDFNIDLNRV